MGRSMSPLCTAMCDEAESADEVNWLVAEEQGVHFSGGYKSVVWELLQSGLLQAEFLE